MSSKILSAAVVGLEAEIVEVEADTGGGEMGTFSMVGLPDAAVSESRERVRYAIKNSGFVFPKIKVGVNLAPADLKKHGPSYDLPIAVSILTATGALENKNFYTDSLFVGELALDGGLRSVNGVLSVALKARLAGLRNLFIPEENAYEAKLVPELNVYAVKNLKSLADHLDGKVKMNPIEAREFDFKNVQILQDMSHVHGQEHVKRALEIAAAGAHNIALSGPPGSGKTLLARTVPSILPDLTLEEALEVTKIYSVAGKLQKNTNLVTSRPFRSPHHTASNIALIGGGSWPRPGEISLSHRGILFLDEFAEFPRQALENLRQPLEDGVIHVSRAAGHLSFPAKFILVASMNPCPCGFSTDSEKTCSCTPLQVLNYRKKISGPIMDRIDIHVEVPRVKFDKLTTPHASETSVVIKERVKKARAIQKMRFAGTSFITNSEMNSEAVKKFCPLNDKCMQIIRNAISQMHLSARAYFRILKLSRTIADLEENLNIEVKHLAEALQYRSRE